MKGIINEIMEIYNNLDADKQNKLDKLCKNTIKR